MNVECKYKYIFDVRQELWKQKAWDDIDYATGAGLVLRTACGFVGYETNSNMINRDEYEGQCERHASVHRVEMW